MFFKIFTLIWAIFPREEGEQLVHGYEYFSYRERFCLLAFPVGLEVNRHLNEDFVAIYRSSKEN